MTACCLFSHSFSTFALRNLHFIGGFFALPWLWLINAVWFFNEARAPNANPKFKLYVVTSFVGALVWFAGIIVWISIYQTQWNTWGASADKIAENIPLGY
eukprot:Colp12_sorted_trinity150504_noHs@21857